MTYNELIKGELINRYGKQRWGLYYGNLIRQAKAYEKYTGSVIFGETIPKNSTNFIAYGILSGKTFYKEKPINYSKMTFQEIQKTSDILRLAPFAESASKINIVSYSYNDKGVKIKKVILSPFSAIEEYKKGNLTRDEFLNAIEEYKTSQEYIYNYGNGD